MSEAQMAFKSFWRLQSEGIVARIAASPDTWPMKSNALDAQSSREKSWFPSIVLLRQTRSAAFRSKPAFATVTRAAFAEVTHRPSDSEFAACSLICSSIADWSGASGRLGSGKTSAAAAWSRLASLRLRLCSSLFAAPATSRRPLLDAGSSRPMSLAWRLAASKPSSMGSRRRSNAAPTMTSAAPEASIIFRKMGSRAVLFSGFATP
mmetsp:Transcript_118405/g.315132  ORF Transcript_118405/g.315132 Transcript_118405/m.315132 type:complete len:207 (+) Transcript_118405:811-1431(+)